MTMTSTVANATIPRGREASIATLSNDRIEELSKSRVIFFAGDVIGPKEKYNEPSTKGFGGICLKHVRLLRPQKGMIYRCHLTMLTVDRREINKEMIAPNDLQNWDSEFTRKNSKWNPTTNTWDDETIKSDFLRFRPLYPGNDIAEALRVETPNGVGGVVEITALKGSAWNEINDAQLFFFPTWKQIQKGEATLPETTRELETHLLNQRSQISQQLWDNDKKNQYQMIVADMLRSCTEYRMSGHAYLKFVEDANNQAKAAGHAYPYPVLAEMYGEQLEQKRKDDLVAGESSAVTELTREMRAERSEKSEQQTRELELREREIALRERELAVKEAELGLGVKPDASASFIFNPTTSITTRVCGQPTAVEGSLCARTLKDDETVCWQHGK